MPHYVLHGDTTTRIEMKCQCFIEGRILGAGLAKLEAMQSFEAKCGSLISQLCLSKRLLVTVVGIQIAVRGSRDSSQGLASLRLPCFFNHPSLISFSFPLVKAECIHSALLPLCLSCCCFLLGPRRRARGHTQVWLKVRVKCKLLCMTPRALWLRH